IVAAQSHWKTEIVFNAGTPASLPAGGFPFYQQCMETVGSAIHRRGQPGRTRADHDQIVKRKLRFCSQSQLAGDLGSWRVGKKGTVGKYDQRQRGTIGVSVLRFG